MKKSFFIILFLVINVVLMVGCATQQPIINTTTRNDSIVVHTEYIHDTTMIEKIREIYNAPDTLFIHDSTVIYKYKDRVKTDTLYRYHTDTTSEGSARDKHRISKEYRYTLYILYTLGTFENAQNVQSVKNARFVLSYSFLINTMCNMQNFIGLYKFIEPLV